MDKKPYRITRRSISVVESGRRIEKRAGEVLHLSEHVARAFADRVEPVIEAQAPAPPVDTDWDAAIKPYYVPVGRYDIPGVGIVRGKDAAIEALKKAGELA